MLEGGKFQAAVKLYEISELRNTNLDLMTFNDKHDPSQTNKDGNNNDCDDNVIYLVMFDISIFNIYLSKLSKNDRGLKRFLKMKSPKVILYN